MANTAQNTAPLGAATILHVVDAFTVAFEKAVEWNETRKTRKALSQLSDAQLEDIGLTRKDIVTI